MRRVQPRVTALDRVPHRRLGPIDAGAPSTAAEVDAGAPSTAAEFYAEARSAWLAGECAKAIELAREANKRKFSRRHVSIIGACACSLRKRSTAKWAYKILRGGQRNMLLQICRSKGVELP